ncbi:PQQ-binding-like beta-propeller repeat protein [Sporosarcina jiandibaonis]|uniref:outer membrane protein assembly factor BamB family protein n=1 Tax=Sporosarcina jiandibaonis TaxID=2715535 RepID=UPI001FE5818C|nr:PQQ-binding-like beta-propeller repeat protein [Sporosarcina jiandibaonis]
MIISIFSFTMLLMLGLAGCSNDSDKSSDSKEQVSDKKGTDKGKSSDKEIPVTNILDWESTDFEDSNHEIIEFEKVLVVEHPHESFAHNGTFIVRGNSSSYFYDYPNGIMSPYDSMDPGDSRLSVDMYSGTYLFEDHYYLVELDRNARASYVTEVNLETGEVKRLFQVNSAVTISKKGDILYVSGNETLIAFDTTKEEQLWEVDLDSDVNFTESAVTDQLIVLLGDEGLAAYSQADGTKQYEVEGFFHKLVADGDTFYALKENDETIKDFSEMIVDVLKFDGMSEEGELFFSTPVIEDPSDPTDLLTDVKGDNLYIKSNVGVLAYDKNSGEHLWTLAIADQLYEDYSPSDFSYDLMTDYSEDAVYIRATKWEHGAEETLFIVVDPKTGEMKENLRIDEGVTIGPNFDGENAVIFKKVPNEYPKMYIVKE